MVQTGATGNLRVVNIERGEVAQECGGASEQVWVATEVHRGGKVVIVGVSGSYSVIVVTVPGSEHSDSGQTLVRALFVSPWENGMRHR